jgi:putative tricarboxylic transport membrane protein
VLVIVVLTVISVIAAIVLKSSKDAAAEEARASMKSRVPQVAFSLALACFAAVVLWDAAGRVYLSRLYPMTIAIVTLALIGSVVAYQALSRRPRLVFADVESVTATKHGNMHYILWIAGLLGGTVLVGFPIAVALYVFFFTTVKAGWRPLRNGILAAGAILVLAILAHYLTLVYPGGLLQNLLPLPRWMGMPL